MWLEVSIFPVLCWVVQLMLVLINHTITQGNHGSSSLRKLLEWYVTFMWPYVQVIDGRYSISLESVVSGIFGSPWWPVIAQQAASNLKIVAEGKILSGIKESSQSIRSLHCGCNDTAPAALVKESSPQVIHWRMRGSSLHMTTIAEEHW